MDIDTALGATTSLQQALRLNAPDAYFTFELCGARAPYRDYFRSEIPAPGMAHRSGVYFITDVTGRILYIGKATAQNLASEICGKFGAAVIVDKTNDVPRFENSLLARWCNDPAMREQIINGNFCISALAIEPPAVASLVEVYLHTLCELGPDRGLPQLNKRIG